MPRYEHNHLVWWDINTHEYADRYRISCFFRVMFFPRIRTEKSATVLNLRKSNFHNLKSSWKYNYDCLSVWIWNQINYIQNILHNILYLIKSKHDRLSPLFLISYITRLGQLFRSRYKGLCSSETSIDLKFLQFQRTRSVLCNVSTSIQLLHTLNIS
jgi:hypothetical protein